MADELKASPQSPALATLARMLRAARSAGDTVTVPYLGGVGTMMLGKSPEEVTEWSYGNAPLHVPQMTRVPQFKKDRAESLADTLFAAQAAAPVARMAPAAARELAPAAGALAMRAAELSGAPVHGLGVIKPKGGNWLAGSVEGVTNSMKSRVSGSDPAKRIADIQSARAQNLEAGVPIDEERIAALMAELEPRAAINKWLETKLSKYIRNEMGTPEDPIRALAERGVTHAEVAPFDTRAAHLDRRRIAMGFPAEGMGVSPQAKAWEAAADDLIHNLPAGERINVNTFGEESALRNLKQNPWLGKVPPETMTYGVYGRNLEGEAQFGHLIDELRNAVNPESGLPASLRWKYGDLEKVTVPQAVQRVHDINEWRAAQKVIADQARANNAAAVLHKDYPDAPYKWVELKLPETPLPEGYQLGANERFVFDPSGKDVLHPNIQSLEDALKYEGETMGHCVGGYCPDVMEGRSRIFSLRNKKTGEPHVTVEVQPTKTTHGGKFSDVFDDAMKHVTDDEYAALENEYGDDLFEGLKDRYGSYIDNPNETIADIVGTFGDEAAARYAQHLKNNPLGLEIVQIKGKANKAPKEEYLPFVQDFVRSGKWSDVGDLENSGLMKVEGFKHGGMDPQLYEAVRGELGDYATMDDILNAAERLSGKKEGYSHGGLVDGATEYNPLEVDHIIDQHRQHFATGGLVTQQVKAPFNEFSMGYDINPVEIGHAQGGSVESTHLPYDEAKISSLVNALREELNA